MMVVNERDKVSGETPGVKTTLDVGGSLFIGAYPALEEGPNKGAGFHGCIKDIVFNRRNLELPNPNSKEEQIGETVNVGSCRSFRKNKLGRA